MKLFGKFICGILMAAFALGTFSACGGPRKDTLYVLSFKPEYNEIFEEVNEIFLAENPEIKKVDYKAVDTNSYNNVFTSRIQSGYLDVFTSEVTYMMQGTNAYMEPLAHADYMDDIKDEFIELGSYYDPAAGGEPELLTLPLERVAYVVYYNKDIFEEYGFGEPTTWSEFIEICDAFAEAAQYPVLNKTRIESPIILGLKSEWPAMNVLNSVAADVIDGQNPEFYEKVKACDVNSAIDFSFEDEYWKDVFAKVETIGEKYVTKETRGLDYSFAATYFSVGNPKNNGGDTSKNTMYPMMIDGTWVGSQIKADFEVGAFALPAIDVHGEGAKKNLAVKTGTTLSAFNRSNKKDYAQKYIEIFFRDEVYKKFVDFAKTPSVKSTVSQQDKLVNEIFDTEKYNFVEGYDSRMPRYFPLVSAAEVASLMKGDITVDSVARTLQKQVISTQKDWGKYTSLSHTK